MALGDLIGGGILVGRGGLEPPASRLSGVRSNHLSYRPTCRSGFAGQKGPVDLFEACAEGASPRSDHCRAASRPGIKSRKGFDGGAYRDRTDDLLNANQALSQLS